MVLFEKEDNKRQPTIETESKVLAVFKSNQTAMSQRAIQDKCGVDWYSLSIILNKFIQDGKIKKIETSGVDYYEGLSETRSVVVADNLVSDSSIKNVSDGGF